MYILTPASDITIIIWLSTKDIKSLWVKKFIPLLIIEIMNTTNIIFQELIITTMMYTENIIFQELTIMYTKITTNMELVTNKDTYIEILSTDKNNKKYSMIKDTSSEMIPP